MKVDINSTNSELYHDVEIYISGPPHISEWKVCVYFDHFFHRMFFTQAMKADNNEDCFEECPDSEVPRAVWLAIKSQASKVCSILNTNPLVYHAYYDAKL